jgi:hypothetical protein
VFERFISAECRRRTDASVAQAGAGEWLLD